MCFYSLPASLALLSSSLCGVSAYIVPYILKYLSHLFMLSPRSPILSSRSKMPSLALFRELWLCHLIPLTISYHLLVYMILCSIFVSLPEWKLPEDKDCVCFAYYCNLRSICLVYNISRYLMIDWLMDGWVGEWMSWWMDGWLDGQMDSWVFPSFTASLWDQSIFTQTQEADERNS